jgi:hypothetical protein
MILQIIGFIGTAGLFVMLFIMYATKHGVPGIRQYYKEFKPVDMKFYYKNSLLYETFEKIGSEGRKIYFGYFISDFFLLSFTLIVMTAITDMLMHDPDLHYVVYLLAGLKALFDILENCFCLYLLHIYPAKNNILAFLASLVTSLKFIMFYLWFLAVISAVFYFFLADLRY